MNVLKKVLVYIFFLLIAHTGFSQKVFNEGTITYSITVQSTDNKTDLAKSLEGAVLHVYLKGTQSRTDMVSSLGSESSLFDSKTGKGYILKEYSGQKLMITMDRDNWNQKNRLHHTAKFQVNDQEFQTGVYRTKRAVGTLTDGKTITVNFTSDLIPGNKQYNNAFSLLPGLPVEFELVSGNLRFTYKLISIDQEIVPSSKFEIPKTGYRVMTYDENQQLKKGENKR